MKNIKQLMILIFLLVNINTYSQSYKCEITEIKTNIFDNSKNDSVNQNFNISYKEIHDTVFEKSIMFAYFILVDDTYYIAIKNDYMQEFLLFKSDKSYVEDGGIVNMSYYNKLRIDFYKDRFYLYRNIIPIDENNDYYYFHTIYDCVYKNNMKYMKKRDIKKFFKEHLNLNYKNDYIIIKENDFLRVKLIK